MSSDTCIVYTKMEKSNEMGTDWLNYYKMLHC